MALTTKLRSEISDLESILKRTKDKQTDYLANRQFDQAQTLDTTVNQLTSQITSKNQELSTEYNSASSTIKTSNNSAVSTDAADLATIKKYQSAQIVGDTSQGQLATSGSQVGTTRKVVSTGQSKSASRLTTALAVAGIGYAAKKLLKNKLSGANGKNGGGQKVNADYLNKKSKDLRVKIKVPEMYLKNISVPEIYGNRGILFPYTPTISYEQEAQYSTQSPLHSIYPIHFFQKSSVSAIVITGKFTVQNNVEAEIFLGNVQLLRALTKMHWGANAEYAGAPPPVCLLQAYGRLMLDNVPIAIRSFKFDMSESVDYFTYSSDYEKDDQSFVPVMSTVTINCIPMYSRDEIKKFNTDDFMQDYSNQRNKGYI